MAKQQKQKQKQKQKQPWQSNFVGLKINRLIAFRKRRIRRRSCRLPPPQFPQLTKCKTTALEDRISALPDELLLQILAPLTLREAVVTGVLSRRWRYVWEYCPNLVFEHEGAFKQMDKLSYICTINKVLGIYNSPRVNEFKVVYPLRAQDNYHIDYWIAFAIAHGVSRLALNLATPSGDGTYSYIRNNQYVISPHVFYRRDLCLKNGTSSPSPSPALGNHFKSLTDLYLKGVSLSDEVFEFIMSSCLSLEKFCVINSSKLVNPKINFPHPRLESFEMYLCRCLEKLELFVPKLKSFKYHGCKRMICIQGSPQLVSLAVDFSDGADPDLSSVYPEGYNFTFDHLAFSLLKLECLVTGVHLFEKMRANNAFSIFKNIKKLTLDAAVLLESKFPRSYHVAILILNAAPFLQQLELNLPTIYSCLERVLRLPPMSPHENLKVLRLSGLRGHASNSEFLAYIGNRAISLEKIEITTKCFFMLGDDLSIWDHRRWAEAAPDFDACQECVQHLRQRLGPNTQLIYLDECGGVWKRTGL